jgi:hypothetical protein
MSLERGIRLLQQHEDAIKAGDYRCSVNLPEPRPLSQSLLSSLRARDRARRNNERQRLYYHGPARPKALSWEIL